MKGRAIGAVYLAYFLVAMGAEGFHSAGLSIPSFAASVVSYGLYAVLILLFYRLFKPISETISLTAAGFGYAGCVAGLLALSHAVAPHVQLLFFAFYCVLIGFLIVKSTFLPRVLGAFMILAGIGWLLYLTPLPTGFAPYLQGLGIVAEAALMLWLLIAGVSDGSPSDRETRLPA